MLLLLAQASAAAENLGIPTSFPEFVLKVWQTWVEGGWLMIPLAGLAFFIYFEAMALVLRLGRAKLGQVRKGEWRSWIRNPSKGTGHVGEVIRFVTAEGLNEDSLTRLEAVKTRLIPEVNQKITVISVLVTIAPLMGLLGTVIGMLSTFRGLASSTGQAAELVAEGIRVALITTQTGLMIAIPGYIFIALAVRKRNQYLTFMTELESAVMQAVHSQKGEKAA
jgi:biopolymer transport protein ExbB